MLQKIKQRRKKEEDEFKKISKAITQPKCNKGKKKYFPYSHAEKLSFKFSEKDYLSFNKIRNSLCFFWEKRRCSNSKYIFKTLKNLHSSARCS